MVVSFDVMQSCAIAAAVVLIGRAIVKRVKFFQTYCIPGVIVCGLAVSLALGILRSAGILEVKWDAWLPSIIRDAVQTPGRRVCAFSKYAQCRIYD